MVFCGYEKFFRGLHFTSLGLTWRSIECFVEDCPSKKSNAHIFGTLRYATAKIVPVDHCTSNGLPNISFSTILHNLSLTLANWNFCHGGFNPCTRKSRVGRVINHDSDMTTGFAPILTNELVGETQAAWQKGLIYSSLGLPGTWTPRKRPTNSEQASPNS